MTGELHPHVHILFLTPARSPRHHTTEWVQAWRQAARLDYDPVCDIRSVRGAEKGLAEVLKYATKPAKLAHNAVTLAQAMAALKGRKLQLAGGCLKTLFSRLIWMTSNGKAGARSGGVPMSCNIAACCWTFSSVPSRTAVCQHPGSGACPAVP